MDAQTTELTSATRGGMPRVALALGGAGWLLGLLALLLYFTADPAFAGDWLFILVDAMVAIVYATVAAVVLARRRHIVAVLLMLTAIGGGLSACGGAWEQFATHHGLPPLGPVAALFGFAWVPGTLALFLVVPWSVRDHPLGRDRWGAAAGFAVAGSFLVVRVLFPDAQLVLPLVVAASVVLGLVTAVAVERRHRHGPPAERNGLGWLALGVAVMALSFLPLLLPYGSLPTWLTPALHLACQALFPAAILTVVLRSRLWGLELAVSRAVLGGTLAAGLVALYLVVTVLAGRLIGGDGPAQVLAAASVAVAVQPARLWLQRRVSRLVYGQAYDPGVVAGEMSTRLGRATSTDELLRDLVQSVGSTLRLESAVLVSEGRRLAEWGVGTSAPRRVGLTQRGEPIGELLVTAPPGETLSARDRTALEQLSGVLAAGLALARGVWQLEAARDHLRRARLEERRVIRRELHDGLGPWLAGLRLGLRGVGNTIERDPAAARMMLTELSSELERRIEDVRAVARSLLPPVLDELGLEAALTEMATRHRENGMQVDLITDGLEDLPPAVAAAAYGIASEAVTNVVRHAGVTSCRLEAGVQDALLRVSVLDAGRGVAPEAPVGVGTRSMRERAEEQGGSLRLRCLEPQGTAVEALIPVPP